MEHAIILKPDELRSFIAEIKTELLLHVNKSRHEEPPMCMKDASNFLGCHRTTLRKKMMSGLPFHTDTDGEYYFYASEINNWIKSKK